MTARADGVGRDCDVLLVSMPFGPLFAPSLGLSLLQARLAAEGRRVRIVYFTIDFAERVGQAFYSHVAVEGKPSIRELASEWIFGAGLFGTTPVRSRRGWLQS